MAAACGWSSSYRRREDSPRTEARWQFAGFAGRRPVAAAFLHAGQTGARVGEIAFGRARATRGRRSRDHGPVTAPRGCPTGRDTAVTTFSKLLTTNPPSVWRQLIRFWPGWRN